MPITISEFTVLIGLILNALFTGFITAIVLVFNDRFFRKRAERLFDKIEEELKKKSSNNSHGNKNVVDFGDN